MAQSDMYIAELQVIIIDSPSTLLPMYIAARTCYTQGGVKSLLHSSVCKSEDEMYDFLQEKIIKTGHWSMLEKLKFEIGIAGISRACSHQLVRHRLATYAQRSQRYVNEEGFTYIIPKQIQENQDTLEIYQDTLAFINDAYSQLYELLQTAGATKRQAGEDARYLLPNACETQICMTVNARELILISRQRMCHHAQDEIRNLFTEIKYQLSGPGSSLACNMVAELMGSPCQFEECKHPCTFQYFEDRRLI